MRKSQGSAEKLEQFLSQNELNINAYDSDGFAPIHWAAYYGYSACIETLYRHKASLELKTLVRCLYSILMNRVTRRLSILHAIAIALRRQLNGFLLFTKMHMLAWVPALMYRNFYRVLRMIFQIEFVSWRRVRSVTTIAIFMAWQAFTLLARKANTVIVCYSLLYA